MKPSPQVALIIETSVVYGRRILAGIGRYLRSHRHWSVFIEQHELGTPPPAWLTAGSWDGILSRPTDRAMARLFRRMGVPVVDLNDLHDDLGLPWVSWIRSLPKPVAIMSCNDVRGLHVLDACGRAGVLVPEEVAVLGVDDEDTMCELCSPPLSSVAPNPEGIGYAAAELLETLMSGQSPRQERFPISPIRVSCRQSTDTMAVADWAVASAARYMRELASQGCRVDDVLEKVHMSRATLEKRFRKHLNRSPKQEIRRIRLERIKQLLVETDLTLERVAELSGFEHPEYMSVVFKRETGQTPGRYRNQFKKEPSGRPANG